MNDVTQSLYAIPGKWLHELLALCGPEDHELRVRVMKSAAPAPADALACHATQSGEVRLMVLCIHSRQKTGHFFGSMKCSKHSRQQRGSDG